MTNPTGEAENGVLRLDFDRRIMVQFRGSVVTSDAGLLAYRELDDALGLTTAAGDLLADARTRKNGRHALVGMLRQSLYGRLAGYEDVNDALRLRHDPAMRWIIGGNATKGSGASPSQMGRFETNWLARPENLTAQFQQRPELATFGQIYKAEWFPRYDSLPAPIVRPYNALDQFVQSAFAAAYSTPGDFVRITALDAAGKLTERGSYSALCTLLSDGHFVYVCEVQRARVDYDGLRRMVVEHVARWQSDLLLVENEGMGSRILGSMEATSLPIKGLDPVKGKIERSTAVAPLCEQGRVKLPNAYVPWREAFERELFTFPSCRFNDQVDAFSWALSWIFKLQRGRQEQALFEKQC